jgi:alpha-D-xyloside xylohydrolase
MIVKQSWPHADFSLHSDDPKLITLSTPRLKIEIIRADSSIIFYDSSGHKLTQENTRTLTPVDVNGEKTYHSERFVNMWDTQEAFYGLGQHQAGVWNYRGEAVDLSQDNTNISIPLLLSSNGYGIFWNNGSRSRFNNRFVHAFYMSSEVSDSMDYYFFYGPDFDRLIAGYRELTGAAPLFGKWAYGYWQCKNRYDSQAELPRSKISRPAYTSRQHRRTGSGGTSWAIRLQQKLSRSQRHGRRPPQRSRPSMISVWP